MLLIPKEPEVLKLPIGRLWNGERCPDSRLSALIEINTQQNGLIISTTTPILPGLSYNSAVVGSRLDAADNLDRLEIFFVEEGGEYLVVVLTVNGQYLVSGFSEPHLVATNFPETPFFINHCKEKDRIKNQILIPWDCFPANLSALNTFLIVGKQILAYYPIVGSEPDLHQPQNFPFARLKN
jgi:hypothetical protein